MSLIVLTVGTVSGVALATLASFSAGGLSAAAVAIALLPTFALMTYLGLQRHAPRRRAYGDISLKVDTSTALEWVRAAVYSVTGDEGLHVNQAEGTVTAMAPSTWRSFGEDLKGIVAPSVGGSSLVHIESRLRYISLVDYGKNQQNVASVIDILRHLAADK